MSTINVNGILPPSTMLQHAASPDNNGSAPADENSATGFEYEPIPSQTKVKVTVRYRVRGRGRPLPFSLEEEAGE